MLEMEPVGMEGILPGPSQAQCSLSRYGWL
jgi:hypothetical protein